MSSAGSTVPFNRNWKDRINEDSAGRKTKIPNVMGVKVPKHRPRERRRKIN